jgi:hypothetical protein
MICRWRQRARRAPGGGGRGLVVSWEGGATQRCALPQAGGGPGAVAFVDDFATEALYGRWRLIAARGDTPSLGRGFWTDVKT